MFLRLYHRYGKFILYGSLTNGELFQVEVRSKAILWQQPFGQTEYVNLLSVYYRQPECNSSSSNYFVQGKCEILASKNLLQPNFAQRFLLRHQTEVLLNV